MLWCSLSQQQGGACRQIPHRAVPFSPPSITPAVSGQEAHGLGRERHTPSQHQPHQPGTNPTGRQVTARLPSHSRPHSQQPDFSKCGERVAGPTVILTHVFSSNPPFKSSPDFELVSLTLYKVHFCNQHNVVVVASNSTNQGCHVQIWAAGRLGYKLRGPIICSHPSSSRLQGCCDLVLLRPCC